MGFTICSKFGPRLSFSVNTVSSISELESSQIIFATSYSTSALFVIQGGNF